jgi:hypothetical protein
MFASLRSADGTNTFSNICLPGLYSGKDEIRYNLLNYTTAMRRNLEAGLPIFENVCKPEDDPTKAGELTAEELGSHDEQLRKNAALAEIFAKELSFLNRTIQMIALIASRYHEEKEDEAAAQQEEAFSDDGSDDSDSDIEANYGDDNGVPSMLMRSQSQSHASNGGRSNIVQQENQLSNMLLIGSGKLLRSFNQLCLDIGLGLACVNAMTNADRPSTSKTTGDQRQAGTECIQTLYARYCGFDGLNREEVARDFAELFELSKSAWSVMSLLAFSNLFRLTKGTDFEIYPINPDDAIFSNRGRPFRPRMGYPAATSSFFNHNTIPPADAGADAVPTTDSDDVASVCRN